MKTKLFSLCVIISIILILSCSSKEQSPFKTKLKEHPQLRKALRHYSNDSDSLKRKAVEFIIENIDFKSGLSRSDNATLYELHEEYYTAVKQSQSVSQYTNTEMSVVSDAVAVTKKQLIEDVEVAFLTRDFPWTKHLTFNEFCEYILPYRIANEPISRWRKQAQEELKPIIDTLIKANVTDPVYVCKVINEYVFKKFIWIEDFPFQPISLEGLLECPIGNCANRYLYTVALCRAIGLPTAIDFTPQYYNLPGAHSCVALTNDGTGKILSFDGGDAWREFPVVGPKMYRYVYLKPYVIKTKSHLPELLTSNCLSDVTQQYPYTIKDIKYTLPPQTDSSDIVLYVFGWGREIVPICKGVVDNDKVVFKNILSQGTTIYVAASITKDSVKFLQNPRISFGDTVFYDALLAPDTASARPIRLTKKYPAHSREQQFFNDLIGAKIQGSNSVDFSNATTLDTIDRYTIGVYQKELKRHKPYKYYRYYQPRIDSLNLAELHFTFMRTDSSKLTAETFFNNELEGGSINALGDMDISTNYSSANWLGVVNSSRQALSHVTVVSRNSLNLIEIGCMYRLWYFDLGWKLLGEQKAADFSLIYDNVPTNALLVLENITKGKQERVFTYGGNEYIQYFW